MQSWKPLFSALVLAALLSPAGAQDHKLQTFKANVPYEFTVGKHKFKPGVYEFIVVGPGLLTVRDGKAHVITRLITKSIQGLESSTPPRLVFEKESARTRLSTIWMQNNAWGLEILGEDVAVGRSLQPKIQEPVMPPPRPIPPLMRQ